MEVARWGFATRPCLRRRNDTRQAFHQLFHPPQRFAAVTDGMLHFGRKLGRRLAELRKEEQRVVAKAVVAAGLADDYAFDSVLCRENNLALRIGKSEAADESR